jgi:hypothetical protein
MSLKSKEARLAMKYLQILLPIADKRMGERSTFMMALRDIESKLAIILRDLELVTKPKETRIENGLSPLGLRQFKNSVAILKEELNKKKGAAVYPSIEGPTKQFLIQVEIIIQKHPY